MDQSSTQIYPQVNQTFSIDSYVQNYPPDQQ